MKTNQARKQRSQTSSAGSKSCSQLLSQEIRHKVYVPIHKPVSHITNKFRNSAGLPVWGVVHRSSQGEIQPTSYQLRGIEAEATADRTKQKRNKLQRLSETVRLGCEQFAHQQRQAIKQQKEQQGQLSLLQKNIELTAHQVMNKQQSDSFIRRNLLSNCENFKLIKQAKENTPIRRGFKMARLREHIKAVGKEHINYDKLKINVNQNQSTRSLSNYGEESARSVLDDTTRQLDGGDTYQKWFKGSKPYQKVIQQFMRKVNRQCFAAEEVGQLKGTSKNTIKPPTVVKILETDNSLKKHTKTVRFSPDTNFSNDASKHQLDLSNKQAELTSIRHYFKEFDEVVRSHRTLPISIRTLL